MGTVQLDAATPPTVFAVFAAPPAGREDELQRWYETVHGPDALGNGSFTALHRFRAVGDGPAAARYLAIWEGRFSDEAEAWAYIRPRAADLRAAGRVGDVASVRFAIMLFGATVEGSAACDDTRTLITVQNDWRAAADAPDVGEWWAAAGLDEVPATTRWRATSDPAGRGAGHHLAVFADGRPFDLPRAMARPGTSPLPPYRTIFGDEAGDPHEHDAIPAATAWVMRWEPLGSQRA
jgi:hypothetical protein